MKIIMTFLLSCMILLIACNAGLSSKGEKSETKNISDTVSATSPNISEDNDYKVAPTTEEPFTLYEDSLNGIHLPFKRKDMTSELRKIFKGFDVTKEIADGLYGSSPLYTIKKNGEDFINISMNVEDVLKVDNIFIKNNFAKDFYGVRIGDTYEQIKKKRKGKIQSSTEPYEARSTYVYFDNSNIMYLMTGETIIPDDNPDFKLSEEQIKNWKVSNIIWRQNNIEETNTENQSLVKNLNDNETEQSYEKGDIVYSVSIGNDRIDWKSTMEVIIREKSNSMIIRDSKNIKNTSKFIITSKKIYSEENIRYHILSNSFTGYIVVTEGNKQMMLVQDGYNPTSMTIFKITHY
jgi:hypothetical protein